MATPIPTPWGGQQNWTTSSIEEAVNSICSLQRTNWYFGSLQLDKDHRPCWAKWITVSVKILCQNIKVIYCYLRKSYIMIFSLTLKCIVDSVLRLCSSVEVHRTQLIITNWFHIIKFYTTADWWRLNLILRAWSWEDGRTVQWSFQLHIWVWQQIFPLSFFLFQMSSHPPNFTLGRREDKKDEKERGKIG